MKNNLLLIFVICVSYANAQKQNIDVDLLSNIISAKQDELKTRVLSNIVVKNIQTTNYTTYNTIYNLVDIITTEKNKTVMTQSLVHQIADYSLVMGLTDLYLKTHIVQDNTNQFLKLNSEIKGYADSLKLHFTASGISALMKGGYYYGTTKTEQSESEIDLKKKDEIKWNSLLANFLIDTAYQLLSKNKTLTNRGFFKKDPQRQFFSSGLDIDYSGVRKHFSENKRTVIQGFIKFLNTCTTIADNADSIAKFVTDNQVQFKDFGKDPVTGKLKITKEQIGFLMYLFNDAISTFRDQIGQNNFIATIGDIISKYVIYDFSEGDQEKIYDFKIDVEAIILAFEDKFYAANISSIRNHKIGIKPFFTIGLTYGYFVNQNNTFNFDNTPKNLTQIALAGEKFGVKFIFSDFKYIRSHPPLEWYKYKGSYRRWKNPVAKPLINNVYIMIYGSGLLYNIVDLKSETNFKYAITGAALGLEFFNGLEFNLGYAIPIIPKDNIVQMLDKGFMNIGFDIPIFEYLKAARDKRK
jgi:hypothetical protein